MSEAKHSVKVLEHDPRKKYVELEVNGEKARVEKFTDEEWDELREREKKEGLSIEFINLGIIPFEEEVKLKGKMYRLGGEGKTVFQRMALAAYRFLWYFGPPLSDTPPGSVYTFAVKYKKYIFEINDDIQHRCLWIRSVHLIPKEHALALTTFDKHKYYAPPKEIREEIVSIIEHLAKTPANMWDTNDFVPI